MKRQKFEKTNLRAVLLNTRQMTSLIERELALATDEVKRETANWVPMWVDWGHTVRSDCNTATAVRAISDRAELLWYVRHDTKTHGYHSICQHPFDALEEAMDAWGKRKFVRASWPAVRALARDLLTGRQKLTVTLQDVENSALCTLGVEWFRDRLFISHKAKISGRTAAILMKVEPQLGFVIYEAAVRHNIWAVQDQPADSDHPGAVATPEIAANG